MAITNLYVDPSIAGNSGAGTVGDPYGDLEWCLSQATFDTSNGTQINIKAGTAEVISATLDLTTNFTAGGGPSPTSALVFRGYSASADDGDFDARTGIGSIDCNNKTVLSSTTQDDIILIHLEIFNRAGGGYATMIHLDNYIAFIECELHSHSGTAEMVRADFGLNFWRCHFHSMLSTEICIYMRSQGGHCCYCYFDLIGTTATDALVLGHSGNTARNNIIRVSSSTNGIRSNQSSIAIDHNSIWSNGGTGSGIKLITGSDVFPHIFNNVIEGFSGSGGTGINVTSTGYLGLYGYNCVYNCDTNYSVSKTVLFDMANNEDLRGSSPFTDAANENFTLTNVGEVRQGAWPQSLASSSALTAPNRRCKGALERSKLVPLPTGHRT